MDSVFHGPWVGSQWNRQFITTDNCPRNVAIEPRRGFTNVLWTPRVQLKTFHGTPMSHGTLIENHWRTQTHDQIYRSMSGVSQTLVFGGGTHCTMILPMFCMQKVLGSVTGDKGSQIARLEEKTLQWDKCQLEQRVLGWMNLLLCEVQGSFRSIPEWQKEYQRL